MRSIFLVAFCVMALHAQSTKQFVATVVAVKAEAGEIEVKPDTGNPVYAKLGPESVIQKVSPGEKDLRHAQVIFFADIATGDRVLIAVDSGDNRIRRLVVMSAAEIGQRDDGDRQDWNRRGVVGVVTSKIANELRLKPRAPQSSSEIVIVVAEKTTYKRYAPDSVRFADAKLSSLDEVRPGDQVWARGRKSEDGNRIAADELVFGTFQTRAGSVVSVDAASSLITVKELGTGKTFLVRLTRDALLKRMPDFGGPMPGGGPPPMGGPPPAGGPPFERPNEASGAPGGRGPDRPDLNKLLEMMPAASLTDVHAGQTVVVSSTKGSIPDSLTAIMLLANADMLIRMASVQGPPNNGRRDNQPPIGGNGMSGMNGFELPGMIP